MSAPENHSVAHKHLLVDGDSTDKYHFI